MKTLIIGYGNTIRGDDGLGPYIVEQIQGLLKNRYGTDIDFLAVPQLDIILITEISQAGRVIFIDARTDASDELVRIQQLEPAAKNVSQPHISHDLGMPTLLRLSLDWYGTAPLSYAVMPKGYEFSISETISERARIAAAHAQNKIIELLEVRR